MTTGLQKGINSPKFDSSGALGPPNQITSVSLRFKNIQALTSSKQFTRESNAFTWFFLTGKYRHTPHWLMVMISSWRSVSLQLCRKGSWSCLLLKGLHLGSSSWWCAVGPPAPKTDCLSATSAPPSAIFPLKVKCERNGSSCKPWFKTPSTLNTQIQCLASRTKGLGIWYIFHHFFLIYISQTSCS